MAENHRQDRQTDLQKSSDGGGKGTVTAERVRLAAHLGTSTANTKLVLENLTYSSHVISECQGGWTWLCVNEKYKPSGLRTT